MVKLKKAACLIFYSITPFILNYCTSAEKIVETYYLGNVNINAPITTPPVHVMVDNQKSDLTVTPKLIIGTERQIESSTEYHYTDRIILPDNSTVEAKNENLEWNLSSAVIGADFDYRAGNNFSLFGGLQLATTENNVLMGGNVGLGFHGVTNNIAMRLDLGLSIQESNCDALTIIHTKYIYANSGTRTDTTYFRDKDNFVNINPFLVYTLNSVIKDDRLNYFLSLGYFTQTILDFEPGKSSNSNTWIILFGVPRADEYYTSDLRPNVKAGFVMINPGIVYTIDEQFNLILSLKILKETLLDSSRNLWMVMPSVQMDIRL